MCAAKKKSSFSNKGQRADIGNLVIQRILPNRYADAVGPFVFLDHIVPGIKSSIDKSGTDGAHPHRGIATLTYILQGEGEHFDSAGNYGRVHSGGVQWMNAGNGIIHDETLNADSGTASGSVHAFQFWINLPSDIKSGNQAYMAIAGENVPVKTFPDQNGWIKVIAGSFEELRSAIPSYSEQFLYHIHLEPGANFTIAFPEAMEVAAFLPDQSAMFNDIPFEAGEFVEFDRDAGEIEMKNGLQTDCEILLFGGSTYREPIFADGPFVMNSLLDIANAYKDFYGGKYGSIDYVKQQRVS
ncbi:pirin family protein [Terrimonas sp. NA20]|uniref:Pirin family protein n=1 Tax=Terrimonas ginsenosidimutans TaxID=2908004 RepID=A0ABS9KX96_9BACT|nr:pirin family protein [Terrimonas ginsenosidimutans]MCG2616987.1 pirin family protein [Terrimonas ginsenosidimutans]